MELARTERREQRAQSFWASSTLRRYFRAWERFFMIVPPGLVTPPDEENSLLLGFDRPLG